MARPEADTLPENGWSAFRSDAREPEAQVRVLLVEDDEDDYLITRDMLADSGSAFALEWCADYDEGLAVIRRQCHDIYLIDYRLGERTGLQLMREGFADRPSAPAIMLTGQATHQIDLEANALGVTDFLVKQELSPARLERSIRYAMSHQKAERQALAARAANDGMWDWNLESDRIYFSPRWHAILGRPEQASELAPAAWFDLVAPEDRALLRATIDSHLDGRSTHLECEHRIRHADGDWRWVMVRGLATRGVDGRPVRIGGSLSDVTAQHTHQLRLEHEALHDTLTGLPNRNLFMDRVEHLIEQESRDPAARCAVLFMDLDGFKAINDTLSHAAGDQLLVAVAQRLRAVARPGDTVARLGGDEFTMLLDRIADLGAATKVAGRVLTSLGEPFGVDGGELNVAASIGVAISHAELDPAQLVANADTAMYAAKGGGPGRIAAFDETMQRREADRLVWQDEVRRVVGDGRLEVHFQPIVELASGRLRTLATCARWPTDHPGSIEPAALIAIAGAAGVSGELGRQVLTVALQALAAGRAAGEIADDVSVSVNLPAHQFDEPDLAEQLRCALAAAGLHAGALKLEISEPAMMELEHSRRIAELGELGVRLHIVAFGTGHTSLAALHRLPVDALKVDGSFVGELMTSEEGQLIVRSTVALGHSLGLPVIAEGIECVAVLQRLRELGCDQGQGPLISSPVRRTDLTLTGAVPSAA